MTSAVFSPIVISVRRFQPTRIEMASMPDTKQIWKMHPPVIVGIAGGSGAGKTWLAQALLHRFKKQACLVSLDDFYRDRSHLAPALRQRINFDHPRSIDWRHLETVLGHWFDGKKALVPRYDFSTHCRRATSETLSPKPVILVEGLWLFRRPRVRKLFSLKIFVDCSPELRLQRRLARDCRERGRTEESVLMQFNTFVEPMHQRFVAPQRRWADMVFERSLTPRDIESIAQQIEVKRALSDL